MAGFGGILKAILTLDNKNFNQGLKKSQKQADQFGKSIQGIGKNMAGAFSGGAVLLLAKDLAVVNRQITNAEIGFSRLTRFTGLNIEKLRDSTGGMVDDLKLMQQTILALNLGISANQLPTFFEFAAVRAAETGVAVDYLVNSIVTGVGRQSRLVLDNLGISLIALNREIAKTGDFMSAAVNIINRELKESGRTVDSVKSGWSQLTTELTNVYNLVAGGEIGDELNTIARAIADIVRFSKQVEDTWFADILKYHATLGAIGVAFRKQVLEPYAEWAKRLKELEQVLSNVEDQARLTTSEFRELTWVMLGNNEPFVGISGYERYLSEYGELLKELEGLKLELKFGTDDNFKENVARINEINDRIAELLGNSKKAYVALQDIAQMSALGESYGLKSFEIDAVAEKIPAFIDHLNNASQELADYAKASVKASAATRQFQTDLSVFNQEEEDLYFAFDNIINGMMGVANAAQSMGRSLSGMFDSQNILASLGQFLMDLAKLMIEFGVLTGLMGTGMALFESGNPYAMIAGGIIIAATAASLAGSVAGLQSKGGGGLSSGGGYYSGSYGGGNYGGVAEYDYNREIVLVARGEDLVGVINRQTYINGTNG